jgi:hypothetical protein
VPDLILVLELLLGLALFRLYTLVPNLGPTLVMLSFPGTARRARAVLGFVQEHREEEWVAQATVGAMARELGHLGVWALTTPPWVQALTWPLWLPGSVRGTVLGALAVHRLRLDPPGGEGKR